MKSNAHIYTDIFSKLKLEPSIDASKITVAVDEGVVTVSGVVISYAQKERVEKAIKGIYGVRAVADELDVSLSAAWKLTVAAA